MIEKREITVTVSKPYVKVVGGWSGLRPVGLRRTYQADVNGRHLVSESKREIQGLIRFALYPVRPIFTFTEE